MTSFGPNRPKPGCASRRQNSTRSLSRKIARVRKAAQNLATGDIAGNGTGSVTLTGSQAEINATLAALNGVVYRGNLNFNGSDTSPSPPTTRATPVLILA